MQRFLKNLFRNVLTTRKANECKPSTRRAKLQMEGLEDRVVLSSAGMNGSTLTIDLSQNVAVQLVEVQANGTREIEVLGISSTPPEFKINPINTVVINTSGQDTIDINDSGGMPFATHSLISIQGSGENSLFFFGNRGVAGNETYQAGGTTSALGSIAMDGLEFEFTNAVNSVIDTINISGTLQVQTAGTNVVQSSLNGTQTLSGLSSGSGGGGTLEFDGMPQVQVVMSAPNASLTLDAASAASSESEFLVKLNGDNEQAIIVGTPNASNFLTSVSALGSRERVNVESNLSLVLVQGDSTTTTVIGQPEANDELSTEGIKANVEVINSATLIVSDQADHIGENWDVTESTISGFGVFGNNFAEIGYSNVQSLNILTSTGTNFVDVSGTDPSEGKTQITITDESTSDFTATITADSSSALNLELVNQSTNSNAPASLFIDATSGAKFSNTHPKVGDGTEDVSYGSKVAAQVDYLGFTSIKLEE